MGPLPAEGEMTRNRIVCASAAFARMLATLQRRPCTVRSLAMRPFHWVGWKLLIGLPTTP